MPANALNHNSVYFYGLDYGYYWSYGYFDVQVNSSGSGME